MKCFWTILGIFWKIEFLTKYRQMQNWWKFCIILKYAKKIFFVKIICSTHQRKCFSTILGIFLENLIFDVILTGATLKKMVKIWTVLNCDKKIFHVKIICSTHQMKFFWTIVGNFWKIEFLRNIDRCEWNFCIISKCAKRIFLSKLFVPLVKGSVSPKILGTSNEVFLNNCR